MKIKKAIIFTDGASRGNPGAAAIGATRKDEQGRLIASISLRIGTATNNEAEYQALIAALEKAVDSGIREVELNSDSELVVKQLKGEYRVKKATLKPLYQRARQLQGSLDRLVIKYIPREQNIEADKLANKALRDSV